MDKMIADKNSTDQRDTSSVQRETNWQSVLAYCQQSSADSQVKVCPCPALKQAVEEIIRLKTRLAQCQHMLFGQSSEKMTTVLGGSENPEAASNVEDSRYPESKELPVQKSQGQFEDQDSPGPEQDDAEPNEPKHGNGATSESPETIKTRRGAKPGHKGHGRRIPKDLPTIEVYIPVPDEERFCQICGKEGTALPLAFAERSTQIEIKVQAVRIVYIREKMKFDCCRQPGIYSTTTPEPPWTVNNEGMSFKTAPEFNNDDVTVPEPLARTNDGGVSLRATLGAPQTGGNAKTRFVTAPEPPQAVNKSKLTHDSIALLIYLKYLLAIPLTRISALLAACGFMLSPSSMTCTFQRHLPLFEALYQKMAEVVKQMGHGNADETRWRSFYHRDGKENFLDWMWVFASEQVVLYVLDKSRSSTVPLKWLGTAIQAVLTVDRAPFYKKLARGCPGLVLAFCWAHFRRDFVRAAVGNALLRPWAKLWIGRIFRLYQLNTARLKALADPGAFAQAQAKLEAAVNNMFHNIQAELKDPNLLPAQREVLESAVRHWAGLTVFVHDPMTPMDNNRAERLLRIVALARKNFYGTYAAWSGEFTAICLSILQTARMHDLEPMAYIKYYLDVCAKAGSVPKDLEPYLPWNISKEVRMSKKELSLCA